MYHSYILLLDWSAAFDTVDFATIASNKSRCLWYCSFLVQIELGREISNYSLHKGDVRSRFFQGSCLGSLLFSIHTQDFFSVLESHLPTSHAYSDDAQLSRAFNFSTGEARAFIAIESCIRDLRRWMCEKKLLLKDDKAEFLLVGSRKQLAKVSIDGVRVGDYNISPSPSVRILGTWVDSYLSMDVNITKMRVQQCILLSLQYQT